MIFFPQLNCARNIYRRDGLIGFGPLEEKGEWRIDIDSSSKKKKTERFGCLRFVATSRNRET